jgi:hypothetical protein
MTLEKPLDRAVQRALGVDFVDDEIVLELEESDSFEELRHLANARQELDYLRYGTDYTQADHVIEHLDLLFEQRLEQTL